MSTTQQDLERALLQSIAESSGDLSAWFALHDLLLEADDPRIDFVRLQMHWRGVSVPVPLRELDDRVRVLIARGHQPVVPTLTNSLGMTFALIPSGRFLMGSPADEEDAKGDEMPQHEVEISRPFFLSVYETTQQQFEAALEHNPSYHSSRLTPGLPVENVSWDEAVEFCKALCKRTQEREKRRVYRLPTEAEWEYACRGGALTSLPFCYGGSLSSKQANFDGSYPYGGAERGEYRQRTVPVDTPGYLPNAWGLYHMHGNVREWVADWYAVDYYQNSPRRDPTGPPTGTQKVVRGNSWFGIGAYCRSACREAAPVGERTPRLGFRVAMTTG